MLFKGFLENSLNKEDDNSTLSLMKKFKEAFQSFVEYDKGRERAAVPFVYFVDELDRCNPTFAVKVLERIKHLFEVPNVVFVLSVDKKQLAYSINGYFGSEQFDSNEYLRRFIDIEYNLPRLVAHLYCGCLNTKYGINQVLSNIEPKCNEFKYLSIYFDKLMIKISLDNEISLRQMEKIYTLVQLMLYDDSFVDSFIKTDEERYFIPICFFMAYLKVCKNDIYQNILSGSYSVAELSVILENLMPQDRRTEYSVEGEDPYDYDHDELCILLVLAHYCEANVLERKRSLQRVKTPTRDTKKTITSLQELNNLSFKRISHDLLTKYESLFDRELKSLFAWLDKMEMYQFEA